MKNFRFIFAALSLSLALLMTPWQGFAQEMSSSKAAIVDHSSVGGSGIVSQEAIVDPNYPVDAEEKSPWETVSDISGTISGFFGQGKEGSDFLLEILRDKDKEYTDITTKLVEILNKCPGLKGGWAKQIGVLKKISNAFKVLDIVGKIGEVAADSKALWEYYKAGDQDKFAEKLADLAIEAVSGFIGAAVGGAVKTAVGMAAVALGIPTGGVGGIIVSAAGWAAGEYVSAKVTEWVEDLLKNNVKDFLMEKGRDLFSFLKKDDLSDQLPVAPPGGTQSPGSGSSSEENTAPVQLQKLKVYAR